MGAELIFQSVCNLSLIKGFNTNKKGEYNVNMDRENPVEQKDNWTHKHSTAL